MRHDILILFKNMHKAIAYPDNLIKGVARVPGFWRKIFLRLHQQKL